MKKVENNRRNFIKKTSIFGFFSLFVPFKSLKIFSNNKENQKLVVKIHPKAVKRTLKG